MFDPKDIRTLREMLAWWRQNKIQVTPKKTAKLPRMIGKQIVKIGIASGAITYDSTGTMAVWRKDPTTGTLTDTGETITVYLDVAHGDESISDGKWCFAVWHSDEQVWRVWGAECEDPDEPNILKAINGNEAQALTTTWTEPPTMVVEYSSGTAIVITAP